MDDMRAVVGHSLQCQWVGKKDHSAHYPQSHHHRRQHNQSRPFCHDRVCFVYMIRCDHKAICCDHALCFYYLIYKKALLDETMALLSPQEEGWYIVPYWSGESIQMA